MSPYLSFNRNGTLDIAAIAGFQYRRHYIQTQFADMLMANKALDTVFRYVNS